ncbi:hybrid sensor histidine kinase/response regulator [Rubrivirga marina]|uniref:hybrid sensor histidine kinase/response regulator n=1 Tax=Rubrivirga marina TaxID=1196024 RepID=UPI00117A3681|nr:ATP-binding protein [Rubrivirga marina]
MEPAPLRVLLVEDDDDHAALVEALLADAADPDGEVDRVATVSDAVAALAAAHEAGRPFDVVLCDQRLPDSEYWETVGRVVAAARAVPVVALTSIGDSDVAVDAMRQGAQDYLVKSEMSPEILRRTVRYAVERARRTAELHASNEALRQTLEHVRQMQAQIVEQEKLAGLGGLLAGVAHELRNPLHLAVGFAEASDDRAGALADHLGDAIDDAAAEELAELRANVAKVAEHGRRADSVLRAMFEHARGVVGELRPVDLHAALDVVLSQARPTGPSVRVERDYDPALAGASVLAVGGALARALYNVVENAMIAAASDGLVRVTTRHDEAGHAVVEVEDDGPGMSEEVVSHVFEPFYTAWGPGRRVGLGLTLAHSVLASHGGRISISSRPEGGTLVRLTFPTAPLAIGEHETAGAGQPSRGPGQTG